MNVIDSNELWARWLASCRLQAEFIARSAEIGSASLESLRQRMTRLAGLWSGMPWPLITAGLTGPATAGVRWADYLEDEARNAAQAALLTEWELRDWSQRFARAVEGEDEV